MRNQLCSDNFGVFFSKIDTMGLPADEVVLLIREHMPLIAEDIQLGKMNLALFAPETPVESGGRRETMDLYVSPSGYEKEELVYEFPTGNGGKVTFRVHAVAGYSWSADEKEQILFLCRTILVICGRARLSDIMERTISRDIHTGLFNANGFVMMGNRMARDGKLQQYTAMYLNLKNFKYVNSRIGNGHGDLIIKKYAMALAQNLKEDEVAARLGGDNFALIVRKERKDAILALLADINLEIELGGLVNHLNMQTRVGAYDIDTGDTMEKVMNCISSAISMARRNSTDDVVVFEKGLLAKIDKEQEIASDFPGAIENREFVVYYQPKVDLHNNELCGGEALVRWFKNDKLVSPGDFIPLFERDGSICRLDFYVLEQVCSDIREWKRKGIEPVTISVNFSKTHLRNPNVAEEILAVVERYGVESKYIEIELTEMSDFSDYAAFKSLVSKMKEHGIKTSIDDFGTGFSSLNLLTDFMFDIVKLDKSFFDNIERNQSKTDEIVVRNMVKMIKELNMSTIAEGVETAEQARFLKEINCCLVQGYLFDRPLPEPEFEERLTVRKYKKEL